MNWSKTEAPFDLRKLTEQELGCVEFVLNSPAYNDVFRPYLVDIKDGMYRMMLDRRTERKEQYPDDFLAGNIAAIDGLLTLFERVLEETRFDRINDAMEHNTPDVLYHRMQANGQLAPVVGADQKPSPDDYDPSQDF